MAIFAKIENGTVTQVIVAEPDFIAALPDSVQWVETFSEPSESNPRKHYAGIGFSYDAALDEFVPPALEPAQIIERD